MREFTTAITTAAKSGEGETFHSVTSKIDGREVTFLPPTESQLAMIFSTDALATTGRVSVLVNFFFSIIEDLRDVDHFKGRMFSRSDPFGAEVISEIVMSLVEEWTGNPTQPSLDSTPSQNGTGERSTEEQQPEE